MRTPVRLVGAVLIAVALSGCSIDRLWNDVPAAPPPIVSTAPSSPQTAEPPAPDERTLHPYTGVLAAKATCISLEKDLRLFLQDIGGVGGAVTYPVGVRVKANAKWWTVAVATQLHENGLGMDEGNVPRYEFFVTSLPSYSTETYEGEPFSWKLSGPENDKAAARALACVKKIPVPKPKPLPGSPETYTGRLARHATCIALSAKQLRHFQDVGKVGGAITYPRGFLVKANLTWWTVAVATQVNPNGQGITKGNTPATALFVTNARSSKASVSFPLKYRKADTAARKALGCLG